MMPSLGKNARMIRWEMLLERWGIPFKELSMIGSAKSGMKTPFLRLHTQISGGRREINITPLAPNKSVLGT